MDTGNTTDTLNWLLQRGRFIAEPIDFVEALGRQLIDAGTPLWRIRFNSLTIHPQMAGWSVIWSTDMPCAVESRASHEYRQRASFIGSPLAHVATTKTAYRRKLDSLDPELDHRLLFDLKEQGATDYLVLPIEFSDGMISSLIFVTTASPGFSDADIESLTRITAHLAPVFEVMVVRHIAKAILDTYVGPRTGERVLAGQIKRGDGETIKAAIWFCDLRDFTPLTESLEPEALLALLNRYFEIISASVVERGGEVLRFIGDAMLIVFPVGEALTTSQACRQAVDAALEAFEQVEAFNVEQASAGEPEIRFGVGLHFGEATYGNVGAPDRLDFTVMGPAVNRTARLEGLTKTLGVSLLMSRTFVSLIEDETTSLGLQEMKGVAEKQEVFSLTCIS